MTEETKDSTTVKVDGEVTRYKTEIQLYEKEAETWTMRSKKIIKRYKDERSANDTRRRFNILWSNVQTLQPALYAKNPKPDIERRFKDSDNLGRVASTILERCASYFIDEYPFGATMRQTVLDRLLPGRGTIWVRYEPHFKDVTLEGQPQEVQAEGAQITDDESELETYQELTGEEVCPDYVHWQDFGHNVARTWEEVYLVWRIAYLTREELHARFDESYGAEYVDKIPLDYTPKNLKEEQAGEQLKKATIYELWDKRSKKAIWLHKDCPKLLDEKEDPLKLKSFFPCPQPIYSTLANDSLIPVPDYLEYQDQADELDSITGRIASITKSLKVAGVYAADAEKVADLLSHGVENKLLPVEQWAMFAEKGGLKGVIELFPLQEIAQALIYLYDARERVKQDLYEITGLSDIIRGSSNANETATAQKIKGNFASMRLDHASGDVARLSRDVVAIMVEIIANHFTIDSIKKICGIRLFTAQEKQQVQMQMQQQAQMAQQAQAQGQQMPPPPPVPEEVEEMLDSPTWEEVEELFKSDSALHFRINIETDSTIKQDEEAEKQARVEFLGAVGGFMQQAQTIQNPDLQMLMGQLLLFGAKGFRVGKDVEAAFESTIKKMEKAAQNPQPAPDPEAEKAKLEMQLEQQKAQAQIQNDQAKLQLEQQKAEFQAAQDDKRMQAEMQFMKEKAQVEMQIEMMKAENQIRIEQFKAIEQAKLQRENTEQDMHIKSITAAQQVEIAKNKAAASPTNKQAKQ